jgi:8-oxo-dGTP pyrophosphatase MutT (NUDIX family)
VHSAAMGRDSKKARVSRSPSPSRGARFRGDNRPAARLFRVSHLRRLRGCEQVAAVCYRVRSGDIEFLLVQTRGGRWTFPKGNSESGLTHAQAAALEAFEEAGVHGRMEEDSFARYVRKRGDTGRSATVEISVTAHLCEVRRLDPPQESKRNPTWFSPEKAKRRLREDRTPEYGNELAYVVDRALARIRRLRYHSGVAVDALQKVCFIDRPRTIPRRTLVGNTIAGKTITGKMKSSASS